VGDRGLLDSKESTFALLYMTRRGLEPLVTEELAARGTFGARIVGEGRVSIPWKGTLDAAMAAARTAFALALPLAPVQIDKSAAGDANDRVARAVVQALTSDEAKARFLSFTRGPVRFRLSFAQGGHRRALVWKISGALAANPQTSWLVNDATDAPWEATVREEGEPGEGFVHVELRPRALTDTRFAYRTGDVPAASHPPLAAALARVAGVREDDVVWDPFVGSGTELVERAKLGPYARLIGSDRDAAAVEVARQNVQMANVDRVTLLRADVFERTPEGVTVILTNPPMGRRVTGDLDLSTLLDRFILTAASVLKKPGSRLVWISPQPKRTRGRAEAEGLKLARALMVDMGGFDAEIQRFDRL
jgi:23S rRNA G2445 N2-methylase RlmL